MPIIDNDDNKNKLPEKDQTITSLEEKIKEKEAELQELRYQLSELKKKAQDDPVPMEVDPDDPATGD